MPLVTYSAVIQNVLETCEAMACHHDYHTTMFIPSFSVPS